MAFQRPTLQDLVTRIEADYVSRLTGGGTLLRRSFVKVIARVQAGAFHLLYGFAAYIAKQVIPDTADADNMPRWAKIFGVTKKPATYAEFNLNITGSGADGTTIPIGREFSRADGAIYVTQVAASLASGAVTVAMVAKVAGSDPNLQGGEILTIVEPIAGVDSQATVDTDGIVDGSDQELNDSLLARFLARVQTPPHGGNKNDYEQWALEVAGVTRAWPYPLYYGAGTVGLAFVRDNDVDLIPDSAEVQQVQDYIDAVRPVTADFTAFAPIADVLNFTISGVSDTSVRSAIQAELTDLIRREAAAGNDDGRGTILISHINEAISRAPGEVDHVLESPTMNIVPASGHIVKMGSITWA